MSAEMFLLAPDDAHARAAAEALFASIRRELEALLPCAADIRHIGATAVPGCLTKGDLDIVVRVAEQDFPAADAALEGRFARNLGSIRLATFAAFEDKAPRRIWASSWSASAASTTTSTASPRCSASILCSCASTTVSSRRGTASRWTTTAPPRTLSSPASSRPGRADAANSPFALEPRWQQARLKNHCARSHRSSSRGATVSGPGQARRV
jgi:GrpB protein